MLGVFITLLYIHTMPNNHYCSKPTSLRCHLMAKHCLRVGRKSRIFPNLRHETCQHGAVKVWQRDLTIMLGVFITLLYTHTMPNNHYCSKPTSLRCHLMAKCCLRSGQKSGSEARNLPTWGCKSMVEGPYNHAGSVHHFVIHPYNAKQLLL